MEVVRLADGSLSVGINEAPGVAQASSPDMLPAVAGAPADNWRYFAVTYDQLAPDGKPLKYYFGSNKDQIMLDVAREYNPGAAGEIAADTFSIGNEPRNGAHRADTDTKRPGNFGDCWRT